MQHCHSVIVCRLDEAVAALAQGREAGRGVMLLSAPGAALHAGCFWWQALVAAARAHHPDVPCTDILDCADGTGQALAALRIGVTRLVLWPDAPGRDAVVAIAAALGGFVLATAPTAENADAGSALQRRTARRAARNGDKPRRPG